MATRSVEKARHFVQQATLPEDTRALKRSPPTAEMVLDTAKNESVVAGSSVISFVTGVTAERRKAILDSTLLAQLVAKVQVPDREDIDDWYDAYFDVLQNIGWSVQDISSASYEEKRENFAAHEAIIAVATALMAGAAPGALLLVKTTLDALKSMDKDSPWITLFNQESQSGKTAHFQVGLAEQDPDGAFSVSLMAFALEAKVQVTQVLFFKARSSEATLKHYAGHVTIDDEVLDGVRETLRQKLIGVASNYIQKLPDLA